MNRRIMNAVVGIITFIGGMTGWLQTSKIFSVLLENGQMPQMDYDRNFTIGLMLWCIPVIAGLLLSISSILNKPNK